ncbi:MAG: tRNA-dihydrouridine synthase [Deltaproteobacteria bacterium]|nr:tRNA-dihydrouridine synthase [Deltaproteobacteria bacterium]MBI4374530.1 tRNA-dihydrouridine synthase [Deltaproteobacteria bacterium]
MVETYLGFWERLSRPVIGLSPMDGVTDFACRYISALHGGPAVIFTEFTTAEGLFHAPQIILRDFEYNEIERPIVAQIYGSNPDDFYRAAHVVCELGFDGIDINMGCPSKTVVRKNCGAKLITVPDLAVEIIRATKQGVIDWSRGQTLGDLKIPAQLIRTICQMNMKRTGNPGAVTKTPIPFSIKTRIGYDTVVIESWIETLLAESPAAISIHGRTLKQMYRGAADWEAIAKAKEIARHATTLIFGNGDIQSLAQALERIQASGVDGTLIGRSAIGNPWIFKNSAPTREEKIKVALEHALYFRKTRPEARWESLKKHLVGYLRSFPDAVNFRRSIVTTKSFEEVVRLLRAGRGSPSGLDREEPKTDQGH